MKVATTIRDAARQRQPLSGTDAQALEGGLAQAERELDALYLQSERQAHEANKWSKEFLILQDELTAKERELAEARAEIAEMKLERRIREGISGICCKCGHETQLVRPGKYQCNYCEAQEAEGSGR